jgi:ubiquinone/menaquinone biosynthesis C-methylase UbiE
VPEITDPVAGGGHDANAAYSLGSNPAESARLARQAAELAADSNALLDRIGLLPGQTAIDLGCGPRGILDLLARRVGPTGQIVGLDADPAHTAMAAEFARAEGLGCVRVVTADARHTGLPEGSFDLVFSRTLLVNVPEPAGILAEMVRLARPGGWVAVIEYDMEHALCYPPHPAFDRLCEIFTTVFARNGADPELGRKLRQMFADAGLTDLAVEASAPVYPPGHTRRTIRPDLVRSMRPHIVALGIATETELDELDAVARAHLLDPATVAISGLQFAAWGSKPG